ncbi:c-type cytochrome [Ancylobacter sp. A5.8]|uniref:c-type cytochrome n=1 Tax=Ancylobacter gelatini TaxID=2919920 RepID=UPI001F4F0E4A|nr:c-type cytochrome [Ancylobacter gelatini]MCJ8142249.1 c-type cytochrome [Ancylobacter gelatini]
MKLSFRITGRRLLYLLAGVGLLGLLVAWSGLVNIGASAGHWRVTAWALHAVMQNSVRTYALFEPPPPADLDSPAHIRRAAGHFETACAFCHGSPSHPAPILATVMTPVPPALDGAASKWTPRQLARIVRHGVKYTGMPAWIAPERDDEVWAMVAFLRALPDMSADDYRRLAFGDDHAENRPLRNNPLESCARCHGLDGNSAGGAFPVIGGQSEAYLRATLDAYAKGLRPSGFMQFAANAVPASELQRLAAYYASRPGLGRHSEPDDSDGSRIAFHGIPASDVPACESCHGDSARRRDTYPVLAGQDAGYIAARLRLMKEGTAPLPAARVMHTIASRLPEEAIEAVAEFYSRQRPAADRRDP